MECLFSLLFFTFGHFNQVNSNTDKNAVSYTHLDVYKRQINFRDVQQTILARQEFDECTVRHNRTNFTFINFAHFRNLSLIHIWFGHKGEEATPYYYKVYLAEYDIVTEMSPTERAVLFRFTFPENEHSYIAVDAFDKGSFIQIIPEENKIIGYSTRNSGGVPENFKNYFIIQFDKPFTYKATVNNGSIQENATEQTTDHAGAWLLYTSRCV